MTAVINSVIGLAIITCLLVGIGGPLVRIAERSGISPKDYIFINYVIGILISILFLGGRGQPLLSSIVSFPRAAVIAVIATIIFNFSFMTNVLALHLPQGHVSLFFMITMNSVIISSVIGFVFLGEIAKVNIWSWLLGAGMILSGAFIVGNSFKN